MSGCNGVTFLELCETQLDMPYILGPKRRENVARLSNLFLLLKDLNRLSEIVEGKTILDRPYHLLPFIKNAGRGGHDL